MRCWVTRRLGAACAVAASTVLLAACGGSGPGTPTGRSAGMTLGKPEVVYTVALSGRGTPAGAPAGRGYAIIALHHRSILCFRFAHLHGFPIATKAVMYTGAHPGRGSF